MPLLDLISCERLCNKESLKNLSVSKAKSCSIDPQSDKSQ